MKTPNFGFWGHGDRIANLLGHPYFIARFTIRKALSAVLTSGPKSKVLDVGCGLIPYRNLFHPQAEYHGLEIDQARHRNNPNVKYLYDGKLFPIPDKSYDIVLCSQVLEHSFEPKLLLSEIFRVLKPGGFLYLTIPFIWPEHEQPFDSQRYTSFGLTYQLQSNNYTVLSVYKLSRGPLCLMQLFIEFLEGLHRHRLKNKVLKIILRLAVMPPYSMLNLIAFPFLCNQGLSNLGAAGHSEIFLDLLAVATRPKDDTSV